MGIRVSMSRSRLSDRVLTTLLLCSLTVLAVPACSKPSPDAAQGGGSSSSMPAVQMKGNYFSMQGHPFIIVGANWVPAKAGMKYPVKWNPEEIEKDFAQMADMGFNTVRVDLLWAWFEPRPGYYNPEAFDQLDYLIKMAQQYEIYLMPILFTGGEVGEAWWDVPWRNGRDPQSDPLMLYLEANLAGELARRYGDETAIMSWDLADEPPFWISDNTTDAMAVNWTRLMVDAIRQHDTLHPIVVGTDVQGWGHGPFRPDTIKDEVDFFSIHPYTIYTRSLFPEPMVSERGTYGAAFATALNLGAGKPVMVQELGASTAQYSPLKITQFERTSYYSALGAGNNGFLPWAFTDAAPSQYKKVPYLRSPHETQFGLTTWNGEIKKRGQAFEKFGEIVGQMNLKGVSAPEQETAIIIPREWSVVRGDHSEFGMIGSPNIPYVSVSEGGAVNGQTINPLRGNQWLMSSMLSSFILAHRAGWTTGFPRELGDWRDYPVLLMPSPLTATTPIGVHVHTDFWKKARDYVREGGVLYASISANAAIPQMAGLFGARMTDAVPVSELTLKVVKPFGALEPGDTFHFSVPSQAAKYWGSGLKVSSGEVIAVDQKGRPALVANTLGDGKTLLSAYPLEAWLGKTLEAFGGNASHYRLYEALRVWSGVESLVRTDQPEVEASALNASGRGYFVLVNHGAKSRDVQLTTTLPVHQLERLGVDGSVELHRDNDHWSVEVAPHNGVILEWAR